MYHLRSLKQILRGERLATIAWGDLNKLTLIKIVSIKLYLPYISLYVWLAISLHFKLSNLKHTFHLQRAQCIQFAVTEGILIRLTIVFNTLSNTWGDFTPLVTLRALITLLSHIASQLDALIVITLVKIVWVTSFLRTHELVLTWIFTFLSLLIVHQAFGTLEGFLKPSIFKGNARVVFTTVAGVSKLP